MVFLYRNAFPSYLSKINENAAGTNHIAYYELLVVYVPHTLGVTTYLGG